MLDSGIIMIIVGSTTAGLRDLESAGQPGSSSVWRVH